MYLDIVTFSESFSAKFIDYFNKIASLSFSISDILDIIFVAVVIFLGIRLIRGTKALYIVKGLVALALMYLIAIIFNMEVTSYLFKYVFSNIFLLLVIIFQEEIRQLVAKLGRSNIGGFRSVFGGDGANTEEVVNSAIVEICKAVQRMSDSKTGALIVMEKSLLSTEITNTGTLVDAAISHELIGNIFYPKSPLHDGAAIVRDGRIYKAGCVLPLAARGDIPSELGTRHRAAIGMSENSDALIVVVSEETGQISVAIGGELTRDYTESDLREKMIDYVIGTAKQKDTAGLFGKIFRKGSKK